MKIKLIKKRGGGGKGKKTPGPPPFWPGPQKKMDQKNLQKFLTFISCILL